MEVTKKEHIFRPSLVVFTGVPLSGKTTLANKVVECSNLKLLDVDAIRKDLEDLDYNPREVSSENLNSDHEKEIMRKSFHGMCTKAHDLIRDGQPVIICGTFSRASAKGYLKKVHDSLNSNSIPSKIFKIEVPDSEVENRIKSRLAQGTDSNINSMEKFLWAKDFFKQVDFVDLDIIDTSQSDYFEKTINLLSDLK